MILYLGIIFFANVLISVLNIVFGTAAAWWVIVMTVASTVFQFAIDGLFAVIVNKLPDRWFAMDKKCFQVTKRSQNFYEKLKIRKWKDKVWELGGLGGFRKNKINEPDNPEYFEKFIIESNKGIVTHRIGYFVGFLGVFLFPLKYAFKIGVPVALVNLVLNILPVMILRYNIPKLMVARKRLMRNQALKTSEKDIEKWCLFFLLQNFYNFKVL